MTTLVIVESPTKVQSIASYLGDGYIVESSRGHIRDLPTGASEVPAKYKGQPWARTGIDVEHDFTPLYVVSADKKATLKTLKEKLKHVDELILATDNDREGEAIAWHLLQELKPSVPVKRMEFVEITPQAIQNAVKNPRELDYALVDAQETRRILDRLYGYEVSPVLWKKVMPKLSAGRVQSVATRLVVDRERERMAFTVAQFADLVATLDAGAQAEPQTFAARLTHVGGKKVATGKDFNAKGVLTAKNAVVLDESQAANLAEALAGCDFCVDGVESKPFTRKPFAPFRTTTLQQEAARKLGFTAQRTMSVAQELYERGFITYMRTDSVTLSVTALNAAREAVVTLYGERYLPAKARVYTSKVKNAQEAHEAIRPAGEHFKAPKVTGLTGDQFRLYELIWMRTVASQMADAEGLTMSVRLSAEAGSEPVNFSASGSTITFPGFLKAYDESLDEPEDEQSARIPKLAEGQLLAALKVAMETHATKPPARYTEASLVAKLEDLDIGRPSTYASIIRTITARDYVFKKGSALVPTWLAFAVTNLLEEHFTHLVDYDFTASVEEILDDIAKGDAQRLQTLKDFYYGSDAREGLHDAVTDLGDIDARAISTFELGDGVVVRVGRYGTYVEDGSDNRANVDDTLPPEELTLAKAKELLANPMGEERTLGTDPETGLTIVARAGRFGPYVTEILPEGSTAKAKTGSLFKDMSLQTVTLEQATQLLSLPRTLGDDDGVTITAQNGRYGPYLKKGTDSRTLPSEQALFTITLEEAKAIYAQPKQRGRAAAAGPLRELGEDPATGKPVVIKDGRFGAYVTDGEYNATLRKDDSVEAMTIERAAELLAEKRAKGPATPRKRTVKKATTKKAAPAKKTTTKKTAK